MSSLEEKGQSELKIERISIPEDLMEEMREIQEENTQLMNQFAGMAEQYFFIGKRIREINDKRENCQQRMQKKFDYLNKKFKLDPKENARIDFKTGEIVLTKKPVIGPAVITEGKSEVVK